MLSSRASASFGEFGADLWRQRSRRAEGDALSLGRGEAFLGDVLGPLTRGF